MSIQELMSSMKTSNKESVDTNNMVGTQKDNIPASKDNSKTATNSTTSAV
jgi:hypothetical protein